MRQRGYDCTDLGWRTDYNAILRPPSIDPHSEKYYSISPYALCLNNPVNLIDPDGRDPIYGMNFWGNTKLIGDDGKKDGKSYLATGSTKRDVKSATKEGRTYSGSLAESKNVMKIATGGVMDDVISSVNSTESSQKENWGFLKHRRRKSNKMG